MKLYFDGGCRPNPGKMEAAVVARGTVYPRQDLGVGMSEQAEWLALLHALEVARSLGATSIELLGDSLAVINQANGLGKCRRPELRDCLAAFQDQSRHFAAVRVKHVRRTQNLAGIALARHREGLGWPSSPSEPSPTRSG